MLKRAVLLATVCGGLASPLAAQLRDITLPARNWGTIWGGMFTNVDAIADPETGSTWAFDDNVIAFGAGYEREVSQGLLLGAEAAYASADFERRIDDTVESPGNARLLSLFATGRLRYGGPNAIGFYLKGAAGSFGYRVPDGDGFNFDLGLSTGGGLEYRFRATSAAYIEWNRIWAYHEKEGIDGGNTGRHTLLRLGYRQGF
jgi:hypothetical protein